MNTALKGISPVMKIEYLVLKYHGLAGIELGTGFILQGVLIGLFLIPIKAPIRTRGDEQHIHNTIKEKKSPNFSYIKIKIVFTAADDPSKANMIFTTIKTINASPGYIKAVISAVLSQSFP